MDWPLVVGLLGLLVAIVTAFLTWLQLPAARQAQLKERVGGVLRGLAHPSLKTWRAVALSLAAALAVVILWLSVQTAGPPPWSQSLPGDAIEDGPAGSEATASASPLPNWIPWESSGMGSVEGTMLPMVSRGAGTATVYVLVTVSSGGASRVETLPVLFVERLARKMDPRGVPSTADGMLPRLEQAISRMPGAGIPVRLDYLALPEANRLWPIRLVELGDGRREYERIHWGLSTPRAQQ